MGKLGRTVCCMLISSMFCRTVLPPKTVARQKRNRRMRLVCLQLEASCLQWSFFYLQLTILAFLLTIGAFLLTTLAFFTCNWSLFAFSGKVHLIRALRDCKRRSLTVSKKARAASKKNFPAEEHLSVANMGDPLTMARNFWTQVWKWGNTPATKKLSEQILEFLASARVEVSKSWKTRPEHFQNRPPRCGWDPFLFRKWWELILGWCPSNLRPVLLVWFFNWVSNGTLLGQPQGWPLNCAQHDPHWLKKD